MALAFFGGDEKLQVLRCLGDWKRGCQHIMSDGHVWWVLYRWARITFRGLHPRWLLIRGFLEPRKRFAVPRLVWIFWVPQNLGGHNPMWFSWVAQPPTSLTGNQDTIRGCATVYLSEGMLVTTCSQPRVKSVTPLPLWWKVRPWDYYLLDICCLESVRNLGNMTTKLWQPVFEGLAGLRIKRTKFRMDQSDWNKRKNRGSPPKVPYIMN